MKRLEKISTLASLLERFLNWMVLINMIHKKYGGKRRFLNRSRSEIIDLNEKLTKDDDLGEDPLETTHQTRDF